MVQKKLKSASERVGGCFAVRSQTAARSILRITTYVRVGGTAFGLLRGALAGTAIGFFGGAILGAASYSEDDDTWCIFACSRGGNAVFAGALVGSAGLFVGSIYGAMQGSETWKPVPLNRRMQPGGLPPNR